MRIQRVSSKWAKTEVILQSRSLSLYIPDTRKYSFDTLKELLGLYSMVYIKPDRGTYGSGVMRAEQRTVNLRPSLHPGSEEHATDTNGGVEKAIEEQVIYILRYGKGAEVFTTPELLHEALLQRIQNRVYLIQKGIDLLQHKKRPFDLRVLTQKTPAGTWETTGMLGRVAAPRKIVTNYHSGGSIYTVRTLFKEHMNAAEAAAAINHLRVLGVQIARQLETAYPRIKEIGLDVALDHHHNLWVLEVNTLPAIVVFNIFRNKSIYRRIHRYATAYGRLKATKISAFPHRRKQKQKQKSRACK
ncbi:YheC/YheD family protein [Paenibacillus albidus]|nr:YheC/YheD family protein [Paenibacillus albidus]